MDLRQVTQRLIRRFGPGVADWCAAVPALADACAGRWGLEPGELFPAGNSSVAIRCARSGGPPAVLKLSPDLPVVAEQVATLRLFGTGGRVPRVLAADVAAGAVLLELIQPGTPASELQPPPSARDWAALLEALHTAPVPAGYPVDLRAQCEGFFDRIGRRVAEPEIGRRVSAADVVRGAERCRALLATETTRVLLHGDLHLGNVLDGGPARGLVAIDPRACVGDPCFDAVDYLLDGAGAGRDGAGRDGAGRDGAGRDGAGRDGAGRAGGDTGRDGVGARCAALAAASGLDAGRLHAWCRAIAPIVAITYVRRPGRQDAVTELLALAR